MTTRLPLRSFNRAVTLTPTLITPPCRVLDSLDIAGAKVTARDLVGRGAPTSWPDIYSTNVNGVPIRWQFANERGGCPQRDADRLLFPFAQGMLPKGTTLRIRRESAA